MGRCLLSPYRSLDVMLSHPRERIDIPYIYPIKLGKGWKSFSDVSWVLDVLFLSEGLCWCV